MTSDAHADLSFNAFLDELDKLAAAKAEPLDAVTFGFFSELDKLAWSTGGATPGGGVVGALGGGAVKALAGAAKRKPAAAAAKAAPKAKASPAATLPQMGGSDAALGSFLSPRAPSARARPQGNPAVSGSLSGFRDSSSSLLPPASSAELAGAGSMSFANRLSPSAFQQARRQMGLF